LQHPLGKALDLFQEPNVRAAELGCGPVVDPLFLGHFLLRYRRYPPEKSECKTDTVTSRPCLRSAAARQILDKASRIGKNPVTVGGVSREARVCTGSKR
jgi:hypothetical protein